MAIKNVVKLSELEFLNRIDGELYNPILKVSHNLLLDCGYPIKRLRDICIIKSGTTPIDRDDSLREGPILFKTTDIRNSVLDPYSNYYHINEVIYERMSSTKLVLNDVLLNIVGATLDVIGRSAFTSNFFEKANITQAMVLLRIKNSIKPGYLFSYLNTKYAQDQIKRYARPTGQYNLNLTEVGHIVIPIINIADQESIQNIVKHSGFLLNKSSDFYKQATDLLEQKLSLDSIEIINKNNYITSNSICVNERIIDPKFHNPKYAQLSNHLKQNFETVELRKIADVEYGYMPMQDYETDPNKGVPLIRVTNITQQIEIKMDDLKYIPNWVKIPTKKYVEKGDILVVQCGDTTGKVGYIYEDVKNHLFPSFCFSVKVKDSRINSLYLAALLKTKMMQILFDQTVMINTVRPNTTKPRFERLTIPILNEKLQKTVSDLLIQSNKDKKESQRLLEEAKTRVEQLIEEAANK